MQTRVSVYKRTTRMRLLSGDGSSWYSGSVGSGTSPCEFAIETGVRSGIFDIDVFCEPQISLRRRSISFRTGAELQVSSKRVLGVVNGFVVLVNQMAGI